MRVDGLKALARKYDEEIARDRGSHPNDPMPIAQDRSAFLDIDGPNFTVYLLEHARWMCQEIQGHDDRDKLNRWLGFVQCILVYERIFKLDDVRGHVRDIPRDEPLRIDEGALPEEIKALEQESLALNKEWSRVFWEKSPDGFERCEAITRRQQEIFSRITEVARQALK